MAEFEYPTADTSAEFPTPWHREAYIADTEREIAGATRRLEELTAGNAHPDALAEAQVQFDNATAELARVKAEPKSKKKSAEAAA